MFRGNSPRMNLYCLESIIIWFTKKYMQIWQPHKHPPKLYKTQFARWEVYITDSKQCLVKMDCGWLVNKTEMLFTKVAWMCREFTAWDVYFIHFFFKLFSMCPQGKQFWRIPGSRWQVPTLSVSTPTSMPHKMILDVWKYGSLFLRASFVWNSHYVKA